MKKVTASDAKAVIEPLQEAQWSPEQKELFDFLASIDDAGKGPKNMLSTIAHHSDLLDVFIPMATKLGASTKISLRDLELLALRTSWRAKSDYEWEHHYSAGLKAGLSEPEMAALMTETPTADFSQREVLLIRTADELVAGTQVSAITMTQLLSEYSKAEVIEIIFVVNQYNSLSKFANSLGMQLESGYKNRMLQK